MDRLDDIETRLNETLVALKNFNAVVGCSLGKFTTQLLTGEVSLVKKDDIGNFSDGSHTFDELYYHRMILFSVLGSQPLVNSWKSKLHDDGSMFPGYFIAGIETPDGDFTYHYKNEYWDSFKAFIELEKAPKWDGHLPEDITRLQRLNTSGQYITISKQRYDKLVEDREVADVLKDRVDNCPGYSWYGNDGEED